MAGYIPIMLECEDRPCLVVGGGMIAERKIKALLEARANVTVISPELTHGLFVLYKEGRIQWEQRGFVDGDTSGYWIVQATTNHESLNRTIAEEAKESSIPVNVASKAELGTFINPAVMKRGRLTIAVSTLGAGPGIAASISNTLAEQYGEEYEIYLDILYQIRSEIKKRVASLEQRGKLLRKLAQCHILEDIREGTYKEWSQAEIQTWIRENEEE
ncbi:precorrin-2 dehydrogenase/sirohydrochlorin ferrochelatase family protein [Paenibacillus sp. FA6]|uniref:precorrin-2 dehydrogenase/sirohydrochlorin ferrochelatase family protein n=1 Tax=Paenibacillus sp. FA6 TaxID=3413029 RepID=UPI003F659311